MTETLGPTAETVSDAAADPGAPQPFAELGLRPEEYDRIVAVLGRRPTATELAMYAVMWSEHCSYKSSKVHLRQFGAKAPPRRPPGTVGELLVGMGENAGVVGVGQGLAVTFKVESHNHPSYVEPYQGAATGIGGIVRDILAMGARPIAVMDPLRFGDAAHPDTARVLPGIVAGIGGYGNCLGLPNIGGELVFDPSYQGNPLVNALCIGVLPADRLQTSAATGVGNKVILFGAKTGRDGIGGVSVLASAGFDQASDGSGPPRRPAVQVGDPFQEKIVTEVCQELFARGLVVGIQDLGGAGLACGLPETAAAGRSGMRIALDRVPLREASMPPLEVLTSESQERMVAVVRPDDVDAVLALARRWGVLATDIGEVTAGAADGGQGDGAGSDGGRLVVTWHGAVVVDVPPASLADDGPVYDRPMRRPADLGALRADDPARLPRPTTGAGLRADLLALIAAPNLCDTSWVTEQFDSRVGGNTVLAAGEDAGVIRLSEETGLGVALSCDGNGRFARLDPYAGAQLALAEAARNVAATGAVGVAVTNCLNFGSPEDPEVMWQFAEAVRGLADGCAELGIPVTGGNVSFYNSTDGVPINPTPVVGVLGVLDDVARRTPVAVEAEGESLLLLGATADELGGSEWAWSLHRHLGGVPPRVDLGAEKVLAEVLVSGSRDGMLSAAHDLSDGGLAAALTECCLRGRRGARVVLPPGTDPFVALFSESAARALVAVPRSEELRFTEMCAVRDVPCQRIGVVDGVEAPSGAAPSGAALELQGQFSIPLEELREAWSATLPRLFGGAPVAPLE